MWGRILQDLDLKLAKKIPHLVNIIRLGKNSGSEVSIIDIRVCLRFFSKPIQL